MRRGGGRGANKRRSRGGGSRGAPGAGSGVPATRAPAPGSGAAGAEHPGGCLGSRRGGGRKGLAETLRAGRSPASRCLARPCDRPGFSPARPPPEWADSPRIAPGGGLLAPDLKARPSGSAMFPPPRMEAPEAFQESLDSLWWPRSQS